MEGGLNPIPHTAKLRYVLLFAKVNTKCNFPHRMAAKNVCCWCVSIEQGIKLRYKTNERREVSPRETCRWYLQLSLIQLRWICHIGRLITILYIHFLLKIYVEHWAGIGHRVAGVLGFWSRCSFVLLALIGHKNSKNVI